MSAPLTVRRLIPWIVLAICLTAVLGAWTIERTAGEEKQRLTLAAGAEQLGLRYQDLVEQRLQTLAMLVDRLEDLPELDERAYLYSARKIIDHHGGFQAVNWISADHVITWTVPEAGNEGALGRDLDDNEAARAAISLAHESGRPVVTPPLELYQRGTGFAVYLPVRREGRIAGFVNGVFRIEELVRTTLEARALPGFGYRLLHRGQPYYVRSFAERAPGGDSATFDLEGDLAGWSVEVAGYRASPISRHLLLVSGLLLALGIAALIALAMKREDQIIEEQARFARMVAGAREGIWVADRRGCATFVNQRLAELLGRREEDLLGRRIEDFLEKSAAFPSVDLLGTSARRGRDATAESDYRHRRPDGGEAWLRVAASAVRDEQGRPAGTVGFVSDISQRRRLEAQLLQTRKMEALGRLAGGVAHDFNNMLTAIMAGSDLAKMELSEDSPARLHLAEIDDAARRAARLTARLLTFSRQGMIDPQTSDLCDLVRDMQTICTRAVDRQGVSIGFEFGDAPVPVRIDRSQFDQVLLNLVVNAADAMPGGGNIRVRARLLDLPTDWRVGGAIVPAGRHGLLEVLDEGLGVAEEIREFVFEPFFTTKEPGSGTGLGLATVHGVVAQAGGQVTVESGGDGSVFRVFLPLDEEARAEPLERPGHREGRA